MKSLIRYICIAACLMDALLAMPAIGQTRPATAPADPFVSLLKSLTVTQLKDLLSAAQSELDARPKIANPTIAAFCRSAGHPVWTTITYPDGEDWKLHGLAGATVSLLDNSGRAIETLPLATVAHFAPVPAGAYTVEVSDQGEITDDSVAVPVSTRKRVDWKPGTTLKIASGTELYLPAANCPTLTLNDLSDVVVWCAGVDKTILSGSPGMTFWSGSTDITIRGGCTVTSGLVNNQPAGNFGTARGTRLAFLDVREGDLQGGFKSDSGVQYLYVSRLTTKSPTSVQSQSVYLGAANYAEFVHCNLGGCVRESTFRTTAPIGAVDLLVYDCEIDQPPPAGNKACITDRTGQHQRWDHIRWTYGEDSFRTGGAEDNTKPTQITDVLMTNLVSAYGPLKIGPGSSDFIIAGGDITFPDGEAFSVTQSDLGKVPWPVQNIRAFDLKLTSRVGTRAFKTYGAFTAGQVQLKNITGNGQSVAFPTTQP